MVIRRVLRAKVVGVTSSDGFLVLTSFQLSHVPIATVFVAIHKMGALKTQVLENASTENARRTDP